MPWVPQFSGFMEARKSGSFFVWGFADTDYAIWMVRPLGDESQPPWPTLSITSVEVQRSHDAHGTPSLTYNINLSNVGDINTSFQVYYNVIS